MNQSPESIKMIRELVEGVVADHYREELPYFQLIWETFRERFLDPREVAAPSGIPPSDLVVGLPFASESDAIPLVTPVALLAVWGTFLEMRCRRLLPGQAQIETAIRSAAAALGASRGVSSDLARRLAPRLHALCSSDLQDWVAGAGIVPAGETPATAGASDERRNPRRPAGTRGSAGELVSPRTDSRDTVYLDRLEDGNLSRADSITLERARTLVTGRTYDIVVDEVAHTLRVADSNLRFIYDIPGMQRGMLWLVLTVEGGFKYEAIQRVFQWASFSGAKSCYPYRLQLATLLGRELRDRIVARGKGGHYRVYDQGWSYFWIRRSADTRLSKLLEGLREPPAP